MATTYNDTIDTSATSGQRYTGVAIALHWAIAALIVYNLGSGLLHTQLPKGFFVFHISSGITILILTFVRIGWRLTHRPPPLLPMAASERQLARVVHVLLYVGMLILPLTGWALISANPPPGSPGAQWAAAHRPPTPGATGASSGRGNGAEANERAGGGQPPRKRGPTLIWGIFRLPAISPLSEMGRLPAGVPGQRGVHDSVETLHLLGGWTMLLLLTMHIGGALKHSLVDRQRELARMWLGRSR